MKFRGGLKVREQEHARNVVANRVLGGLRYLSAIDRFRDASSVKKLVQKFGTAFKDVSHLKPLMGEVFPRQWSALYLDFPVPPMMSIEKELVWAIQVCALAKKELGEYVNCRRQLEAFVCQGRLEEALVLLDNIELRFGKSLWLAQSRLGVLQQIGDSSRLEVVKKLMFEEAAGPGLSSFLLRMMAKKFEVNGIVGQLAKEIDKIFDENQNNQPVTYIKARFLRLPFPDVMEIPVLLHYESACSLIDYYEALISSLRSLLTETDCKNGLRDVARSARDSLAVLEDERLILPFAVLLERADPINNRTEMRGRLIEACIREDSHAAVNLWKEYSLEYPGDIAPLLRIAESSKCVGEDELSLSNFLSEIYKKYKVVQSKSSISYAAALTIFEISERFGNQTWSAVLESTVRHQLAQVGVDANRLEAMIAAADTVLSPSIGLLPPINGGSRSEENMRLINQLFDSISPLHLQLISGKLMPGAVIANDANAWINQARIDGALRNGESNLALLLINERIGECSGSELRILYAQRALAYCQQSKYVEAAKSVVEGVRFEDGAATIYPIKDVANGMESKKIWADSIDVPLLYEAYLSFVDKDKITNLRISFEMFQERYKIKLPVDAMKLADVVGMKRVVAYLADVWKPEVMSQTIFYPSAAEIEDARIEVCKVLQDIDLPNSALYRNEFKQRVRRREIGKGTSLVEKSKVYVDMAAIRRNLKSKLDGAYMRYKGSANLPTTWSSDEIKRLYEMFDKAEQSGRASLAQTLDSVHKIFGVAKTDVDLQFDSIYSQVMTEFVSGENGLNAYLSTRVRHGKLANALRKPLMDERIITARNKDGTYVPNLHWDLLRTSLDESAIGLVKSALLRFSERFDRIVDFVNEKVIAVSLSDNSAIRDHNDPAAFKYHLAEIERRHLQEIDRDTLTFDNFIDRCMDRLWQKTDLMLDNLREYLAGSVRSDIIAAFEFLSSELDALGNVYALRNLQSSIGRARTNTQHKINEVVAWFKRDEFYDRIDYNCEFSAQVALSIINKTLPSEVAGDGVSFNANGLDWLMPGRTLDGMVDMFDVLVMNAVHHSGLKPEQLDVRIMGARDGRRVEINFSNRIGDSVDLDAGREKLAEIAAEMRRPDFGRRAQREGNSGLLKIWRTLNSTFYFQPELIFDYLNDGVAKRFEVVISFYVEGLE
ncbi:hypothetical protein [Xanthomonas campestris]|uniref:hypothetical protein n=1 Tax=Xanthomonas campestris TaxID=339 RepID=UPI001E590CDC|nr:hypothetical protein [Xanthomonas campestris]MCC5084770.1 hypothetical protein [Xanthomonas campestris]